MSESEIREAHAAHRKTFLRLVEAIRPRLHAYCGRMVGSAMDGEDVLQEVLAEAYFKLSMLAEGRPIEPWLFRIAHNRCIDFIRRHRPVTVPFDEEHDSAAVPVDPVELNEEVTRAVGALLQTLPPRERACVLLKDVLDCSLAEIAAIVNTTVGGVKSALHRGRARLRQRRERPEEPLRYSDPGLVARYVASFNRRDWDAVRELIRADARLEVVGAGQADGIEDIAGTYFRNYQRFPFLWRLTTGLVDGEETVIQWRLRDGRWYPHSATRLSTDEGRIVAIHDYIHTDYLLAHADIDAVAPEE